MSGRDPCWMDLNTDAMLHALKLLVLSPLILRMTLPAVSPASSLKLPGSTHTIPQSRESMAMPRLLGRSGSLGRTFPSSLRAFASSSAASLQARQRL
eukprot:755279-Hanusia_phi.AAC.1